MDVIQFHNSPVKIEYNCVLVTEKIKCFFLKYHLVHLLSFIMGCIVNLTLYHVC